MLDDFLKKYDTSKSNRAAKRENKIRSFVFDGIGWVELFCIALVAVILFITFIARHSPVEGPSMLQTLTAGDILVISDLGYTPKTGDVVIIQTPAEPDHPYVKRVIATQGQKISINFSTWTVWVDDIMIEHQGKSTEQALEKLGISYEVNYISGEPMKRETLINSDKYDDTTDTYSTIVEAGKIFYMGDNRNNSKDSRLLGEVDARRIFGEVKFRLFPFNKFGSI